MNMATLVTTGAILLVVCIALFTLAGRRRPVVEVVRRPDPLVPTLPTESEDPPAASRLVEGYCVRDKKKFEMVNPQPTTLKNGTLATFGLCPLCGTKIYKIDRSILVPEHRERVQEGRLRVA
jgi:hypothetical protein